MPSPFSLQNLSLGIQTFKNDGRSKVLVSVALGWFLVLGMRLVMPVILPGVILEYDLSLTAAGGALTILWIAYSVVQFPAGIFSDNFGERKILTLSILIGTFGVLLFSFSPSFNFFIFACIIFGLGSGLFGTPRVTSLSKIYPENDGTVLGFTFSAGNFGSAVLPFIAGILATYLGWRYGFIFCIPIFIITIFLLWNSPFKPPSSSTWGRYEFSKNIRLLVGGLSKRDVLLVSSATLLSVFTFQGFTSFFPLFLITMKSTSTTMATTIFSVFFITGAISQPISGIISDKYGERKLLLSLAALHAICLLSLPFIHGTVPLILLTILLGTRAGLAPVNNAYLASSIPSKVQGSGLGLLRSIFIGLGALASFMVGFIADNYSFDLAMSLGGLDLAMSLGGLDLAFISLGGLFFIATLCYFSLPQSRE